MVLGCEQKDLHVPAVCITTFPPAPPPDVSSVSSIWASALPVGVVYYKANRDRGAGVSPYLGRVLVHC